MPGSRKSSAIGSPKPVNIFYIWYAELCRRTNSTPLTVVKPAKPKNDSVLDFVSDRIKAEEWMPVLNALRTDTSLHVIAIRSRIECKFLNDVDTEEKVKCMKRKFGTLWTAYLLNCLVNSLVCCITRTSVLTCLELDGLPLIAEYLQLLLEGLRKNKTVRILSLKHCPIRDNGCQLLCNCLRYMPNIEILNLTSCSLGTLSAESLAKVIRCQQINRYCESWHSSLRYEDPEVGAMAGLKRITLNNNPHIGDEGLQLILNELDDDLWIKAIDMQRCNITESIANRLLDVVDYSRSLEIADFRNNDQLSSTTIEKIFNILKTKQRFGYECEYQWCMSTTTIPYDCSTLELVSPSYVSSNIQKSKSAPFKQTDCKNMNPTEFKLRRTKTFAMMSKQPNNKSRESNHKDMNLARKEVLELNAQLQQEITKRIETEKQNEELKQKLQKIKHVSKTIKKRGEKSEGIDKLLSALQTVDSESEPSTVRSDKPIQSFEIKMPHMPKVETFNSKQQDNKSKEEIENGKIIEIVKTNGLKKPVEFLFTRSDSRLAQNLFENLIKRNSIQYEDSEDEDLISVYCESRINKSKGSKTLAKIEEDEYENASNASLVRYVKEMQNDKSYTKNKIIGVSSQNGYKNETNCYKKDENGRRKTPSQVQKALIKVPPIR